MKMYEVFSARQNSSHSLKQSSLSLSLPLSLSLSLCICKPFPFSSSLAGDAEVKRWLGSLGLLVEWEGEEGKEGVRTHEKRTTAPEKRARGEVGSQDEREKERGRGDEERRGEEEASQSLQSRRESKRIRKSNNGGVVGVTGGVEGVGMSDDSSWGCELGGGGNGNGKKGRGKGGTRDGGQGKKTCSSVCTPRGVGGGGKETESVTECAGGDVCDQRGHGAASAKGGGGGRRGGGGIKEGRVEVVWAHTSHRWRHVVEACMCSMYLHTHSHTSHRYVSRHSHWPMRMCVHTCTRSHIHTPTNI